MNPNLRHILGTAIVGILLVPVTPGAAAAAPNGAAPPESSLKSEIQSLRLPKDQRRDGREKLYVVQDRARPLRHGLNISLYGANNFNPGSFIESQEAGGSVDFYFTNRFYTGLSGTYVFNELNPDARKIWEEENVYPDSAFVNRRGDMVIGMNLLYGKMRMTRDTVFYFDQYLALGAGVVEQTDGIETRRTPSTVGDFGFVFWFGRASVKIGVKDHYHTEYRRLGSEKVHHVLGYTTLGVLLGGGNA